MSTPYVVVGHPVAHSLSPRIHRAFAQQTGIDLTYEAVDVEPGDFESWARRSVESGAWVGANVTLPYKTRALALADHATRLARRAGAANTLKVEEGYLAATNTDGLGLIADFDRLGIALADARVLVLGAGGSARGVLGPLMDRAPEVVVANRTVSRAEQLVARFVGNATARSLDELAAIGAFDVIVNCTSMGHDSADTPVWPRSLAGPETVAYDLSYGNAARGFLRWAEATGCHRAHDGLGMLVGQAAESFAVWHGVRPKLAPVLDELSSGRCYDPPP